MALFGDSNFDIKNAELMHQHANNMLVTFMNTPKYSLGTFITCSEI